MTPVKLTTSLNAVSDQVCVCNLTTELILLMEQCKGASQQELKDLLHSKTDTSHVMKHGEVSNGRSSSHRAH